MNFTIKILNLYKDLCYTTQQGAAVNKNETLWSYVNGIAYNDLEPRRENFLRNKQFMGCAIDNAAEQQINNDDFTAIYAGRYLFLQGITPQDGKQEQSIFEQAAEELYLESLWQELRLDTDCVYLRKLEEDDRHIFQFFRKIL